MTLRYLIRRDNSAAARRVGSPHVRARTHRLYQRADWRRALYYARALRGDRASVYVRHQNWQRIHGPHYFARFPRGRRVFTFRDHQLLVRGV